MFDQYMQNEENGSASLNLPVSLSMSGAMRGHQYVTRRHKRKKKKGSRTTYTVVTTNGKQRRLNTEELVNEMSLSESLSKEEKSTLKYECTNSEDPRWQRKAKAWKKAKSGLARNPWARAQEQEYDSDSGEGNNTKSGSGTGSSAHLRIRTAATRTRRPRAPPPGKVFDSKD